MKSIFTIRLQGDLDAVTIEPYSDAIDKLAISITSPSVIVLDFAQVRYLNSTAIGNIAHWFSLFQDKSSEMHLVALTDNVYDTLELVGLLHAIPHHKTIDDFKLVVSS
ncbi:MAG: STAS domain-containing protein [Candidatus Gracilibacteria bacterium]|nr:STAS domain-containing protein [Candidatus Gracilibacteria bacterium]